MPLTTDLPSSSGAVLTHADWRGYLQALPQTGYAILLVFVMLLPANFIAHALTISLYRGTALAGAHYAAIHHLHGYWIASDAGATAVKAGTWWVAATWECLFWASCASAVLVCVLWLCRAALARLHARAVHTGHQPWPVGTA
ncbi:MAG: hypothetical protein PVSMB4_19670 [Ktedonobacterales bacterium]